MCVSCVCLCARAHECVGNTVWVDEGRGGGRDWRGGGVAGKLDEINYVPVLVLYHSLSLTAKPHARPHTHTSLARR